MEAPFEMTEGRKRLHAIIEAFPSNSPHWNEAQNRFQFVDRLLTECLGWEHPYVEVESTDEFGGRADYLLGRPVKAVLEAKREAKSFEVLPSIKGSIVRRLRPLLEACGNLQQSVLQVIPYCSIRGAQIAIVCNGPQLVLFQALVIGESPLDGECFLFNGFDVYFDQFPLLWTLLSPEGVAENRAYRDLALHRNPRIPPKASTAIPEPNRYRYRNQFQEQLQTLASLLLEDIEDDPAVKPLFYKECYVSMAANNRHLLLSKRIISSRYERVAKGASTPTALSPLATIDEEGGLALDPALTLVSARPIVVIGDVGVGKTSFFDNLFERLDVSEKANTYFIHINLGIKANLANDLKAYILSEVPQALKLRYGVNIDTYDFAEFDLLCRVGRF